MKRFLYANIILIIFFLVSCAHNAVSIAEEPIIEEKIKVYRLISMHTAMNITISIGISIDMIKTTRKTDNAEKRRAEGDYLSILQTAYSIKIEGNRLIIYTRFIDEPLIYEEIED